jgi:hypothetical protein
MEKRKYVTIDIDSEEDNIAVLDLGVFDVDNSKHLIDTEKVLVEALKEHFDCEVKITRGGVVIKTHPLCIEFHILVCSDGEDYNELVTLNQTWVYKN